MNIKDRVLLDTGDLLIINKPSGIASQGAKDNQPSMWSMVNDAYSNNFHLSNRLDQPVSGCLVFTKKTDKVKRLKLEKIYIAIVEKKELSEIGRLIHFVKRDPKKLKSICSDKKKEGFQKAVLNYKIISTLENYHILEVRILTGRFHQIRSQFSFIGIPIKGDVKYGARRKNHDRSIYLHAWKIRIKNGEEEIEVVAPFPENDTLWSLAKKSTNDRT